MVSLVPRMPVHQLLNLLRLTIERSRVQMCMYTIPMEIKKRKEQSVDEYKVSIGFLKDEGGEKFETFEKYSTRMGMNVALLAAIMQVSNDV